MVRGRRLTLNCYQVMRDLREVTLKLHFCGFVAAQNCMRTHKLAIMLP